MPAKKSLLTLCIPNLFIRRRAGTQGNRPVYIATLSGCALTQCQASQHDSIHLTKFNAHIDYPDINKHGWLSNREIYWMHDAISRDIEQLLEDEYNNDGTDDDLYDEDGSRHDSLHGSEVESDDDELDVIWWRAP